MLIRRFARLNRNYTEASFVNAALDRIAFLQMVVQGAAASVDDLPWLEENPDVNAVSFALQIGNFAFLARTRLDALSLVLRGLTQSCNPDFREPMRYAVQKIESGENPAVSVHNYLRQCFIFESLLPADQWQVNGSFRQSNEGEYPLARQWLLDTLGKIECGMGLDAIMGAAHNNDVFTRLCFGNKTPACLFHPSTAAAM